MAAGSFSDSKKRFQRAGAQGFPNLDHFIRDDGSESHREPNADCFNRQSRPSSDLQPDQNVTAIFPPAIRQSERRFPKQADQEKQKKREAERSPVNKPLRGVKKTG